ncbi:hypothetical protein CV102_04275 [Natronococcus pandeyae]|uniref:Uncharacterized protein n=1 Tax=Natronococcus pandeyae TaxID=2055836 RepID=A0A8J8TT60_9EURY|nr:hypothetical protein [Natronococcus pandeyae]TYL39519.1 hypothetical protein CV102_04275 [Natronococcus pandeyae]
MLADERRQQILFSLADDPSPTTPGSPPDAGGSEIGVRVAQYHTHLPKRADHGFVRWTPEENVLEEGTKFEEIRPVLELLEEYRE